MVKKVNAYELEKLCASNATVLAKFFATWCGPCRQFAPAVEKFAAAHPEITVCELDIDDSDNLKLITELGISTVPTIIFYRNGEIVTRNSGFLNQRDLDKLLLAPAASR